MRRRRGKGEQPISVVMKCAMGVGRAWVEVLGVSALRFMTVSKITDWNGVENMRICAVQKVFGFSVWMVLSETDRESRFCVLVRRFSWVVKMMGGGWGGGVGWMV